MPTSVKPSSLNVRRQIQAGLRQTGNMKDVVLTVTDPAWATVLLDPQESVFYTPFLGQDCTVSEAAQLSGASVNTAYARVRRLLKLGLLRVNGEQRRAGRAVKMYRMVAERFFVPYEVTVHESYAALLLAYCDLPSAHALSRNVARTRAQIAPQYGLELFRTEGALDIRPATAPGVWADADPHDGPALFNLAAGDLMLNHTEAKALQRELTEIWQRYRYKDAGGRQCYLLRLGFTPDWDREP
jgi:hypothetical protein